MSHVYGPNMSEKNFVSSMLDLVFPRQCLRCRITGTYACDKCLDGVEFLESQECPGCRKKMEYGSFCGRRCAKTFAFDQLVVAIKYDKESFVKKMIVRFKYKFSRELSKTLAKIMIIQFKNCFGEMEDCNDRILLVPVPIHPKKIKQRGFNQSRLLAEYIAKKFRLELVDNLIRIRSTKAQAKLGRRGRLKNLKDSIGLCRCYEEGVFKDKVVFLIDDVATTGSTLHECSKVLKACGASWVCGLVIARGQ